MSEDAILAKKINREHQRVTAPGRHIVDHAIRCGQLLIEAQALVPKGGWIAWLRENVSVHVTTAFDYMRLARHADQVSEFTNLGDALAAISERGTLSREARQEMVRLHSQGVPVQDIAAIFGVKRQAVWYHTSTKARNRIKTVQKRERRLADRALERQREARKMAEAKGPLSLAYSLIRKAQQQLDAAYSAADLEVEARVHVKEALNGLYTAEDEVVKASKLT